MNRKSPLFLLNRLTIYAFLGFFTILCFAPFLIMIVNATHSSTDVASSIQFTFGTQLFNNYNNLVYGGASYEGIWIWTYFINSFQITIPYMIITIYVSSLTAYALAFYVTKFTKIVFAIVIVSMMIPQQLTLIGFFSQMNFLGLLDTYVPHYIGAFFNGMFIFFVCQYMKQAISYELIEAAQMDGAGYFKIFHSIIFRLSLPAIATMSIFSFVLIWNNYITSLVVLFDNEKYPLSLLIATLKQSPAFSDLGAIYLLLSLSVLPILFIYLFCARFIISGLNTGSVKG